ncbi:3993_t:CDS:2 [Diversispora eburnea]|uniref:3993_t:CDS:1 n=1 Tax=Diversispora eburnea TaxID=1213867 RepID=A0A9N9FMZ3_9GLOM|nr:3993_t:CDS:2 [Diversispora eburnea]
MGIGIIRAFPIKPCLVVYPFFGIDPVILDPINEEEIKDTEAECEWRR